VTPRLLEAPVLAAIDLPVVGACFAIVAATMSPITSTFNSAVTMVTMDFIRAWRSSMGGAGLVLGSLASDAGPRGFVHADSRMTSEGSIGAGRGLPPLRRSISESVSSSAPRLRSCRTVVSAGCVYCASGTSS